MTRNAATPSSSVWRRTAGGVVGGDEHEWDVAGGRLGPQLFGGCQGAHARHRHIERDQVRAH